MLANLHTRKRLQARLDTPTPLELIGSSIKKRIQENVGDHGNDERLQAARTNIAREVAHDDVGIKQKNRDMRVQNPVLEAADSDD